MDGMIGNRYMINITLDQKICIGSKCSKCAYVCPNNVFTTRDEGVTVTSPLYCKMCNECLEICPTTAIRINMGKDEAQ